MPLRQAHLTTLRSVEDHSKEDEELGPGAVALIHSVGKQCRVLAQPVL